MFIYGFMIKRCACLYVEVTLQTQTTLPHLRLRIIKNASLFFSRKNGSLQEQSYLPNWSKCNKYIPALKERRIQSK